MRPEGVVRWHENGDMAVGEPEVDDRERSWTAIRSSERADGKLSGRKTEIVHVVGECGVCASWPLCRRASISS